MKYISIDIETTGLNPLEHQILSFGAIIEDTRNILSFDEIPKFYITFKNPIKANADFYALGMNGELLKEISMDLDNCTFIERLPILFIEFLLKNNIDINEKLNLAGKNLAMFDLKFLEALEWRKSKTMERYGEILFNYKHRIIDPSILFTDFITDNELCNLSKCKERAGLNNEVTHNALQDAWDVIQILRTKY